MRRFALVGIVLLAVSGTSACGKVLSSVAKGVAHESDNAVAGAVRSAAPDEALAASSASHVDDSAHAPKPAEETSSGDSITSVIHRGASNLGKEAGQEVLQEGLQSALSDEDQQ
jgi:hypothetical protein